VKIIPFPRKFHTVAKVNDKFRIVDGDGDYAKENTDYGWLPIEFDTWKDANDLISEIRKYDGQMIKIKITGQMKRVLNSMFFVWWRWQEIEFEQYEVLLPAQIRSDIFEAMLRGPNV
jgi:hypothetical protein